MAKTQVLDYYINLHDAALVAALQAQIDDGNAGTVSGPYTGPMLNLPSGGFAIFRAPDGAAIEFAQMTTPPSPDFPVWNVEDTKTPSAGGYIDGPNLYTNNRYPKNVAFFTQSSGWWLFGSTTKFYWAGHVRYVPLAPAADPGSDEEEPTELAPIPARRMLYSGAQQDIGDTYGRTVDCTTVATNIVPTRQSSRLGGFAGLQMIDPSPGSVQEQRIQHIGSVRSRWERINFMVPFAPDVQVGLCRMQNQSTSGTGFGLAITPSMQLVMLNFSSGTVYTVAATFDTLVAGQFYKLDCLYDVNANGDLITCSFLLNGVLLGTGTRAAGGLLAQRLLLYTSIGESLNTSTNAMICFADWISSDVPKTRDLAVADYNPLTAYIVGDFVRSGSFTYRCIQAGTGKTPGNEDPVPDGSHWAWWRKLRDPIDFQLGSHLAWVGPKAFSGSHNGAAWAGDHRLLMQKGGSTTLDSLVSSTANSLCEVTTDMPYEVDQIPGFIGWVAAQVNGSVSAAGAADGSLGYKVGAAAAVDTTVAEGATLQWFSTVYSLPALTQTPNLAGTALLLRRTHSSDAATVGRVACLHALVEVIGKFGPEDAPVEQLPEDPLPTSEFEVQYPNGFHNCMTPLAPWHRQRDAMAPIIVRGGTYVGGGVAGVTISFPLPPVFLFIRLGTGNVEPLMYWPTIYESHPGHDQGGDYGSRIGRMKQDYTFAQLNPAADQQLSFDVHIGANQADVNTLGATYQYIAFMDPAARFSRAGALAGHDVIAPFDHLLADPDFLAEFLFAFQEAGTNLSTSGIYSAGPGSAAGQVSNLMGTGNLASALTIALGKLTVGANWTSATFNQYGYLGFRRADGNNHPDQAKVMFLGTYTGDGTASRTINVAPATGLRPLFLIIQPVGNVAFFRDPTHTLATSSQMNNAAPVANGITAGGIDSFTIGVSVNTNLTVYNYWGLWGSATAGNGGWSGNGEFTPVPSDSPFPSDWTEPSVIEAPTTPPVSLSDEPDLDTLDTIGSTTFNVGGLLGGQVCEVYTRAVVNRALHHIGVSKRIANLATEASEEAYQSRDHIKEDINAVLREFDWPFATRYQELVLVDGTATDPVNEDWQYSYRAPNAMMKARRIVGQAGQRRTYDPNPIKFRLGMDDDGPLIFTNEVATTDVPVVLEYTVRHLCPAFYGDALFREALAWKHASSLAMALSRDSRKQAFALEMYRSLLPRASAPAANEQQQDPDGDASWITDRN